MKITKIRNRKNIRKSKKSINNQHGGITYEQYKSYIEACKKKANAEWHCRKMRENDQARGLDGGLRYDNCIYDYKHNCKEQYIKMYGNPPARPFLSRFGL
jgi:hypothetical protein